MIHAVAGILTAYDPTGLKILVAERPAHKPYAGYWEFPGGKVEPQESSIVAIKRELQEELAIETIALELWQQHEHVYPDKKILLDLYVVHSFIGDPLSKEKQILRWVNYAELKSLRLLDGNYALLQRIGDLFV